MNDVPSVGQCKCCDQGTLHLALNLATEEMYVVCDECLLTWTHPLLVGEEPLGRDILGPGEVGPVSRHVYFIEVEDHPWREYIDNWPGRFGETIQRPICPAGDEK